MNKSTFNPIKEDVDGKKAHSVVWTSESIDMAIRGLGQGKKLVANPFYEYNTKLLKGDLVFQRTKEEEAEFVRCMNDIVYFANKYCKLMTPEGIRNIQLRPYQVNYLRHLEKHNLSIFLSCRQSGKTTTSAIFLLHYILFNTDKNSLVLGNKRKTAVEILDKIRKIFYEIPHFLKPGVFKWNESEIAFDNGCRCMAEATTINSGISFTFHCVLADEFAHIPPNILDKFYNNLFPTITAGKARFIISSTQNGFNLFQRLYIAAENGENDYGAFRTDWWEVPEWNPDTHTWDKRDDEWKRRQIANYGSEEAFEAQFGTRFMVNCRSLIDNRILNDRISKSTRFINKHLLGVPYSECFYWLPDYEPNEELIRENLLITIDIGEGIKRDSTVFVISRVYPNSKIKVLGYFKSNTIRIETCALILCRLISSHINHIQDRCLISFELNTYGQMFFKCIRDISEQYSSLEHGDYIDYNIFIKYGDIENTRIPGVKLTSKNKPVFCSLFKQEFENGDIEFQSSEFLREIENFVDIKDNGSYAAIVGHDDIAMASIQISAARQTDRFKYFIQEISLNEVSDEPFVDLYNVGNYNMGLTGRWGIM